MVLSIKSVEVSLGGAQTSLSSRSQRRPRTTTRVGPYLMCSALTTHAIDMLYAWCTYVSAHLRAESHAPYYEAVGTDAHACEALAPKQILRQKEARCLTIWPSLFFLKGCTTWASIMPNNPQQVP